MTKNWVMASRKGGTPSDSRRRSFNGDRIGAKRYTFSRCVPIEGKVIVFRSPRRHGSGQEVTRGSVGAPAVDGSARGNAVRTRRHDRRVAFETVTAYVGSIPFRGATRLYATGKTISLGDSQRENGHIGARPVPSSPSTFSFFLHRVDALRAALATRL